MDATPVCSKGGHGLGGQGCGGGGGGYSRRFVYPVENYSLGSELDVLKIKRNFYFFWYFCEGTIR